MRFTLWFYSLKNNQILFFFSFLLFRLVFFFSLYYFTLLSLFNSHSILVTYIFQNSTSNEEKKKRKKKFDWYISSILLLYVRIFFLCFSVEYYAYVFPHAHTLLRKSLNKTTHYTKKKVSRFLLSNVVTFKVWCRMYELFHAHQHWKSVCVYTHCMCARGVCVRVFVWNACMRCTSSLTSYTQLLFLACESVFATA